MREKLTPKQIRKLIDALEFYADPNTYFAVGFFPDRPCGDFLKDFSKVDPDYHYNRPMPGKRARKALAALASAAQSRTEGEET